ncbi:hypothetical protein [Pontibacillus yanchengensis]|uniref:Uncharacterized protein n=1 Tax=Pontibacillus yanchengensis Y32 TaxID=1385514 RepID=A0A0A2TKU3_9BACI|nr:hypothetical protein [Pontibacillus yanchengensis]KGP74691.1 hypothetical protein N782_00560 [Pontibacillus yanchengensis Y32]
MNLFKREKPMLTSEDEKEFLRIKESVESKRAKLVIDATFDHQEDYVLDGAPLVKVKRSYIYNKLK